MTKLNEDDVLVFADIETTGLDPEKDFVLEVGLAVTDLQLNYLGDWSSLVLNDDWRARCAGNEFVWDMHTKSGLIRELDNLQNGPHDPNNYEPAVVAFNAYKWLTEDMGLPDGRIPCAGSSVHFDRDFFKRTRLIVLDSFFSYRNIDVSSLKELCRRYNKGLWESISQQTSKTDAVHRALPDISSTVFELKTYLDNFLFIPGNLLEDTVTFNQPVIPGLEIPSASMNPAARVAQNLTDLR